MTTEQKNELKSQIIANKAKELYPNDANKQECFIKGASYAMQGDFNKEFEAEYYDREEREFKERYCGYTKEQLEKKMYDLRTEIASCGNMVQKTNKSLQVLDIQSAIQKGYYAK